MRSRRTGKAFAESLKRMRENFKALTDQKPLSWNNIPLPVAETID
jgi:hypothetical protein